MREINKDRLRQLAELLRRLDDARNGDQRATSADRAQAQAAAITGALPDTDENGGDYLGALSDWLTEDSTRFVFVYGTLKSGHGNHYLLEGEESVFVDTARVAGYGLTPGGGFPYAIPRDAHSATGEVYAVDDATFGRVDGLEGVPYHYDRDHVDVRLDTAEGFKWVTAWIYVANERTQDAHADTDLVETWESPRYERTEEDEEANTTGTEVDAYEYGHETRNAYRPDYMDPVDDA